MLLEPLREQLERARAQHERDLRSGAGWVELPDAYARKSPTAGCSWPWQWLVPARRIYTDSLTGQCMPVGAGGFGGGGSGDNCGPGFVTIDLAR